MQSTLGEEKNDDNELVIMTFALLLHVDIIILPGSSIVTIDLGRACNYSR